MFYLGKASLLIVIDESMAAFHYDFRIEPPIAKLFDNVVLVCNPFTPITMLEESVVLAT